MQKTMTYYDDIADGYDALHQEEQEKKIAIIKKHLVVLPGEALLDVGCGSGISTRCWECIRTGIDPSEKLIAIAKEKDPQGTYLVHSAEALPFPDRSFDVVISVSAVHNFSDALAGLREMKRVGKGRYVITLLKRCEQEFRLTQIILANFPVKRIVKEEKDTIFFC
jgi:ubiquinone/menaquinone biosynthesis C-methylase UbiE